MNDFYRNIWYNKVDGVYEIRKNGEYFDSFKYLEDALYERDCLEECFWDYEELVHREHTLNPYHDKKLPPFVNPLRNIYWENNKWLVAKIFNKKRNRYGSYDDLKDAINRRDFLESNEWGE